MIDRDGQVVRALRIKIAKTVRWIDRTLREDAREAVRDYLKTRQDSYPWLFISHRVPGILTWSAAHQILKSLWQ